MTSGTNGPAIQTMATAKEDVDLRWMPILMYHRIVPDKADRDASNLCTTIDELDRQMRYLVEHGYETVHLDDIVRTVEDGGSISPKQVAVTFDDGYMDFYENALPVLQKYKAPSTMFLVSKYIGGTNVWDFERFERVPLLDMPQIREMQKLGVHFGSHSTEHHALTSLDRTAAWREMVVSKTVLEQKLGQEVRHFAFPYGAMTPVHRQMLAEAGYSAACAIETRQHTMFGMSRIDAAGCHGAGMFWKAKISGRYFNLRTNAALRRLKSLVPK